MLSADETSALLVALRGDATLQAVAARFSAVVPADQRFRACCAMVLLLEDRSLFTPAQRVALWYLLWAAYGSEDLTAHPFIAYFLEAGEDANLAPPERHLLVALLQDGTLAGAGAQYTAASYASLQCEVLPLDGEALRRRYLKQAPAAASSSSGPTAAHATGAKRSGSNKQRDLTPTTAALSGGSEAARGLLPDPLRSLAQAGFEPTWARPAPGVLSPVAGEVRWLALAPAQHLLWDSCMGEDAEGAQRARELVAKALSGPLLPAQQQAVLSQVAADPTLVHRLGLTPAELPALVEHTPVLAYELLLLLLRSRAGADYFAVLASTSMSLHSMEVVNRLTAAVELPREFVHRYVTNCIRSCEGITDKYMQNRLVRLVCVFLTSLIRNRIIDIADLLHEVQAFCINFSRIREAAGLFRLLKQLEAGTAGRGGGASSGMQPGELPPLPQGTAGKPSGAE